MPRLYGACYLPQNCTKSTGYLYIDNLQFIYGTNTNDMTRPVLESVTETSSGTELSSDGSTVLNSGNLTFNARLLRQRADR